MYAVIQTGGKQYRVSQGDRLRVELLEGEVGKKLAFEPLLVGGEGEVGAGGVVAQAGEGAGGPRPVGGALAVEVGQQRQPAGDDHEERDARGRQADLRAHPTPCSRATT